MLANRSSLCEESLKIWRRKPVHSYPRHPESMQSTSTAQGRGYRALVVDDEVPLTKIVASYLEREQFDVEVAHNGDDAIALARVTDPDVVILDLALPGIDGLEVCRTLRTFSDSYVLMLTARDTEVDTVVGLSVGADDYVTKPFSPRELMARIRAMLRRPRTSGPQPATIATGETEPRVFGALSIDPNSREVCIDGEPVMLTRTEFDLLAALSSRPGVVFTRRQLIEEVWSENWVGNEHLVDVHLAHVRRKLADSSANPRYVVTVRGVGYRMGSGR